MAVLSSRHLPQAEDLSTKSAKEDLVEILPNAGQDIRMSARKHGKDSAYHLHISLTPERVKDLGWKQGGPKSKLRALLNGPQNLLVLQAHASIGWRPQLQNSRWLIHFPLLWASLEASHPSTHCTFVFHKSSKTLSIHLPSWAYAKDLSK